MMSQCENEEGKGILRGDQGGGVVKWPKVEISKRGRKDESQRPHRNGRTTERRKGKGIKCPDDDFWWRNIVFGMRLDASRVAKYLSGEIHFDDIGSDLMNFIVIVRFYT